MKAAIEKIMVMERIRKEITRIPELAADIEKNGLLNPVTVMPLDGGELRLLAGLRRVKAAQTLGWVEIEVNVVSPADAEAALRIEISENEQREQFTSAEKAYYGGLMREIEEAKALVRKSIGGKGGLSEDRTHGASLSQGRVRDIIGETLGMSGTQYERLEYIAQNAPEKLPEIDRKERSIRGTYNDLRAKEKAEKPPAPNTSAHKEPVSKRAPKTESLPENQAEPAEEKPLILSDDVTEEEQMKYLSEKDKAAVRKLREFNALPPEGKIAELQRQLREERARAATAESELAMLRDRHSIDVDHKDSIIESLKRQNAELSDALTVANARIAELEKLNNQ